MEIESLETNESKCQLSNFAQNLAFFVLGCGIGALTALLLAPKSGREFRHEIAYRTGKGYANALEIVEQVRERGSEIVEKGREKGVELLR